MKKLTEADIERIARKAQESKKEELGREGFQTEYVISQRDVRHILKALRGLND